MTSRKYDAKKPKAKRTARPRITVGPIGPKFPAGTPLGVDRGPLPEGLVERAAALVGVTTPRRPYADELAASLQAAGEDNESIARTLRGESEVLASVADRFDPPPGGVKRDPYEAAMRHVSSRIGGLIVRACDQLSEEIASYAESDGGDDYNVKQALRTLWLARWEIGITKVDGQAEEYWIDEHARRVREENEPAKVSA